MPVTHQPAVPARATEAAAVAAPLTTAQKLEALRRVQAQAEQRVKLGTQLLKAAEAHTSQTQSYVEEVRQEQNELREQLEHDVAAALHQYDQWVGTIDESLTRRLQQTEQRLDALDKLWEQAEQRIGRLVKRAEHMFEQSRTMLESATNKLQRFIAVRTTPVSEMPALKIDSATQTAPLNPAALGQPFAPHAPEPMSSIDDLTLAQSDEDQDSSTLDALEFENNQAPTMLYAHLMKRLREQSDDIASAS